MKIFALVMLWAPGAATSSPESPPPPVTCETAKYKCDLTAGDPVPKTSPAAEGTEMEAWTGSASAGSEVGDSLPGWPSAAGPGNCRDVPLPIQPVQESPYWDGHTVEEGVVVRQVCPGSANPPPILVPYFVALAAADPAPTAPPPPSPEVLAQQAIAELVIPVPTISIGPDRSKAAVNLWTWLWVDEAAPVSATAAAGGVSVTATATLTSTIWTLGEPAPTGGPYQVGPAVTITCDGVGSPPPANYDWKAEPPCGHNYSWVSTRERTGTGAWPVTVTTNWAVIWQSNTGVTGADSLAGTADDALQVGEYRTVLVQGPGG